MQVTIDVPDSLPQERLRQRIKELEESLREEAQFLAKVNILVERISEQESRLNRQTWLGYMAETGKITGDILAPTSELVSWEALEK